MIREAQWPLSKRTFIFQLPSSLPSVLPAVIFLEILIRKEFAAPPLPTKPGLPASKPGTTPLPLALPVWPSGPLPLVEQGCCDVPSPPVLSLVLRLGCSKSLPGICSHTPTIFLLLSGSHTVTQKSEDVHVKWLELELKILYQIMEGGFLACSLHAGATMTAGYAKLNLPFSHTSSFRRNSNPASEVWNHYATPLTTSFRGQIIWFWFFCLWKTGDEVQRDSGCA